jgi:hypothetical protein
MNVSFKLAHCRVRNFRLLLHYLSLSQRCERSLSYFHRLGFPGGIVRLYALLKVVRMCFQLAAGLSFGLAQNRLCVHSWSTGVDQWCESMLSRQCGRFQSSIDRRRLCVDTALSMLFLSTEKRVEQFVTNTESFRLEFLNENTYS